MGFDVDRLSVTGSETRVAEGLRANVGAMAGQYAVSGATLLYQPGTLTTANDPFVIVWRETTGKERPLIAEPDSYRNPRLSPDGKRLAYTRAAAGAGTDLWVFDRVRGLKTRLTFDAKAAEWWPAWTPDGQSIAYAETEAGIRLMYADGSGERQTLTESKQQWQVPMSFSPGREVPGILRASSPNRRRPLDTAVRTERTAAGVPEDAVLRGNAGVFAERPQGPLWATSSTDGAANHPPYGGASYVYNVIDVRQSYLQKLLKQALIAVGHPEGAQRSHHFSYEMVALSHATARELGFAPAPDSEDAKRPFVEVSGRKGLGVKADDLLDTVIKKAGEEVAKRNQELSETEWPVRRT